MAPNRECAHFRPIPNLYHGDFDQEAVNKGVKSRPRGYKNDAQSQREAKQDDYHDIGTPVVNAQNDLQKALAYAGVIDGWFGDKMKEAVKLFQDAAEKGEFLIDGVLTDVGEKLAGHKKGTLDVPTQLVLKKVKEKGWKVPGKSANKTSEAGIELIMKFEGFRAFPYNDAVGHATIGYGTLLHKGNVTEEDKKKYPTGISKEKAKEMLIEDVRKMEPHLIAAVKVSLNQNQFDALISWTYNLGTAHLVENKCSWLKNLNQGHYGKVPDGLMLWNKATDEKGKLVELPGLTERRKEEGKMFQQPIK